MRAVCLHGAGESKAVWRPQVDALDWVEAWDLPGHGDDGGEACDTLEDYCQWIENRIQVTASIILVGHSMGGAIALRLALVSPRPVWLSGLVLLSTGAKLGVNPKLLFLIDNDFDSLVDLVAGWPTGSASQRKIRAALREDMVRAGQETVRRDYRAVDHFDITADLGRIDLPVLVLMGENDTTTPPSYGHYLAEQLPDCSLVIVPGAGHVPMLENPVAVTEALTRFRAHLLTA